MKTLFTLSAILVCVALHAQVAGTLDSTFAENGYAIYSLGGEASAGTQIIQQPDGKLIVTGGVYNSSTPSPAFLIRLNPDSTVDNSFASNGVAEIELDYVNNVSNAILESDGKITLALLLYDVSFDSDPAFVRYTSDGQPDSSFGMNGIVTLNTAFGDPFNKIFPDNDGYFSVNRHSFNQTTYLHRWNDDGTPDINFGTAGTVTIDNFGLFDATQQGDGKLILHGGNFDFQLRRYMTEGVIDSTYGSNGIALINTSGVILTGGIYTDSLDRTYVHYGVDAGGFDFYPRINRFFGDGSFDIAFGSSGDVDLGDGYFVTNLDGGNGGKITIAGSVEQGNGDGFILRLLDNGSKDPGFGTGGETILSLPATNEGFSDLLCSSGKIYTVGRTGTATTGNVLVVRFNDDVSTSSEIISISEPDISVMPNPSTTFCFIKSAENIKEVRILNAHGKTCISLDKINKPEAALNVAGLAPGLYFMQIRHQESTATRKLLVGR